MAFNWQTFKTRALTAIVFVVVMLAGLLWNQWSFLALFTIIHFGCWWEYLRLIEKIHQSSFHPYTKLGLMLIGYGFMLWFCGPAYEVRGYGLKENLSLPLSASGFALLAFSIFQRTPVKLKAFAAAALGLLYISLSWGLMMNTYKEPFVYIYDTVYIMAANHLSLLIIISIWINDTMAYIVGSIIGKAPLSKISPKKTWEGTTGGIVLCVSGVGLVAYYSLHLQWLTIHIMVIAAIASIAGTLGDLLESKLKRMANVKDSGSLMPGHGGFLDRFDSLLIAIPFVWLYVYLMFR